MGWLCKHTGSSESSRPFRLAPSGCVPDWEPGSALLRETGSALLRESGGALLERVVWRVGNQADAWLGRM